MLVLCASFPRALDVWDSITYSSAGALIRRQCFVPHVLLTAGLKHNLVSLRRKLLADQLPDDIGFLFPFLKSGYSNTPEPRGEGWVENYHRLIKANNTAVLYKVAVKIPFPPDVLGEML